MSGAAFAKPGNDSTINQTFDANVATVDQASSSWGSTSTIDQAGVSNTAEITQRDDGRRVGISVANLSAVTQSGDSNQATVDQSSAGAPNRDEAQN